MEIKLEGRISGTPWNFTLTLPPEVADILKGLADLAEGASAQLEEERKAKAERLRH